jgi:DNA-binding NtrC family response regulator
MNVGSYHILILDLNPIPCPAEHCTRLPKLIQSVLPAAKVHLYRSDALPREQLSCVPDLILVRPSFRESLNGGTLRKEWNRSSVLTLFCVGWDNPKEVFQSLLNCADDFLSCPFSETDISLRIKRLLHRKTPTVAPLQAREIKQKLHLESLVGESECFLRVVEKIPPLAHSDATVVISGETGTGKELFARATHYHSPRQGKPFIPVNCGALPDHLFENELFGHARGAFTDAASAEKGLIAEAEGGTLFLDEIDTLSPSAQVKLLRFLQNGEYRPLGCSKSIVADVRIIAATNSDLRQRVALRLFREDLYYRLNALSLSIPPLRDRIADIGLLSSHFLAQYARQYSRESSDFSSEALQKMMVYAWPGNVRELEGVIQRAIILTSTSIIQAEDIDLPSASKPERGGSDLFREAKNRAIEQFERTYLISLLTAHQGNITRAAKSAGKERRSFQRLLRKYRLDRHSFY